MVFVARSVVYEILKEKKLVASKVKFDKMCQKSHWKEKRGRNAVEHIFAFFDVKDDEHKNLSRDFLKWLNGKDPSCTLGEEQRSRHDMSLDESTIDPADVSMTEEVDELTEAKALITKLQGQLAVAEAERDEARDEVARLKAAAAQDQESELSELFGKRTIATRSNGSGRQMKYKEPMYRLCLRALAYGVPARHLAFVLQAVADQIGQPEESTPSCSTLTRWRAEEMPVHNERQLETFITNASWLALMLDCSALRTPLKVSAIVLGSDTMQVKLLDIIESEAKTGENLADQVERRLNAHPMGSVIISKLKHIQSDMGSSQKKCNELLVQRFAAKEVRNGMPAIEIVFCGLHTIINVDNRMKRFLAQECQLASRLHTCLKILFGNRVHSSFSANNLNRLMSVRLNRPSPFKTDCGGRIKIMSNNGRELLLNELAVRETAFVGGNEYAEELQDIMEASNFPEVLCQASIPWALFTLCLSRLHGAFIGSQSYGQVKAVINQSNQLLDDVLAQTPNMAKLVEKLVQMTTGDDQTAALNLQHALIKVNSRGRANLDDLVKAFIRDLRKKLSKDVAKFLELGSTVNDDDHLYWANTKTESIFAIVKYLDLKFSTMKLGNIIELAKAHFNGLTEFLALESNSASTTKAERQEIINRRKTEEQRLDASFVRSVYRVDFE